MGYGVRDTSIRAGFTSSVILEGVQNLEVSAESLVDRNQESVGSELRAESLVLRFADIYISKD